MSDIREIKPQIESCAYTARYRLYELNKDYAYFVKGTAYATSCSTASVDVREITLINSLNKLVKVRNTITEWSHTNGKLQIITRVFFERFEPYAIRNP